MYSYAGNETTNMDCTPIPVDAAAALAAAFGIGFDDMANDRSSPLDPVSKAPTAPPTGPPAEPVPTWQNQNTHSENDHDAQPLGAATALGASFCNGFDFAGLSGEGFGMSTPMGRNAEPQPWQMNDTTIRSSSPSQSPELAHQIYGHIQVSEPPHDTAPVGGTVGLRYDGEESRDWRPSNVTARIEANMNEEAIAEDKTSKAKEGRTRKKFKKRTGTTRERTGCLTCRQRRKKCDNNTYPICGHCRRLNLECVREAPRTIHISVGNTAQTSQQSQPQPTTTSNTFNTHAPISAPFDIPQPPQNALAVRRHSRNSMSGDLSGIAMHGVNFREIGRASCRERVF